MTSPVVSGPTESLLPVPACPIVVSAPGSPVKPSPLIDSPRKRLERRLAARKHEEERRKKLQQKAEEIKRIDHVTASLRNTQQSLDEIRKLSPMAKHSGINKKPLTSPARRLMFLEDQAEPSKPVIDFAELHDDDDSLRTSLFQARLQAADAIENHIDDLIDKETSLRPPSLSRTATSQDLQTQLDPVVLLRELREKRLKELEEERKQRYERKTAAFSGALDEVRIRPGLIKALGRLTHPQSFTKAGKWAYQVRSQGFENLELFDPVRHDARRFFLSVENAKAVGGKLKKRLKQAKMRQQEREQVETMEQLEMKTFMERERIERRYRRVPEFESVLLEQSETGSRKTPEVLNVAKIHGMQEFRRFKEMPPTSYDRVKPSLTAGDLSWSTVFRQIEHDRQIKAAVFDVLDDVIFGVVSLYEAGEL